MAESSVKLVPSGGYPRELREKALELQKLGYTKVKIADTLGLGRTTVRRWLKSGVHFYFKPHASELKQKAVDLVRSGISREEAAERLGISYFTVVFWARGIATKREHKHYPLKLKRNVRKLAKAGITKRKIAISFGLPYNKVLDWTSDINGGKYTCLYKLFDKGYVIAKSSEVVAFRWLCISLPQIRHVVIGRKHVFFLQDKAEKAMKGYLESKQLNYLSSQRLNNIKRLFIIPKKSNKSVD
jgi:hypothetical protein